VGSFGLPNRRIVDPSSPMKIRDEKESVAGTTGEEAVAGTTREEVSIGSMRVKTGLSLEARRED